MFKPTAFALLSAMAFTSAAQVHHLAPRYAAPLAPIAQPMMDVSDGQTAETLTVYYTPLASTAAARYAGFGIAHHMAIVYTDAAGVSHGASSGPSDLQSPQTAKNALTAVLYMASDQPSTFGTLIADPHNDRAFTIGSASDYYTKDSQGRAYPRTLVLRARNLKAQWASILDTYTKVGELGLSYAPMSQNSNSLAVTALKRAGVTLAFSSTTPFIPGAFTTLP